MSPTFRDGDLVVGRRRVPAVSRGDAVVFTIYPSDYRNDVRRASDVPPNRIVLPGGTQGDEEWLSKRLKRVVAVAGDPAPATLPPALQGRHDGLVPAGHIAVAGDNPKSEGSAQFGYVQIERVESVVVRRLRKAWTREPVPVAVA